MKWSTIVFFSLFVFRLAWAESFKVAQIADLSINSAITPATLDYLKHQLGKLPTDSLVVIRVNTPGGLVTTTKDIITMIGKHEGPVVVWISPEGASASSAGAIVAASAHFILMSPGSNMGAATPVGLGEDIKEGDARNKAMNDLMGLVRSLSHARGRPSGPFEDMIKSAGSYTDKEALRLKIIDGIVSRPSEIPGLLSGKTFVLQGKTRTLEFAPGVVTVEYEPSTGQKILEVLANPSTAYFLFLIGVALIYFELQAPGGLIAGSLGVVFLILAAIAFQVLPLNWGAFGLILLGVLFFVLEVFITSYGILTIAGILTFVMGSLFLFHGDEGFISIEYPVMLSTLAGVTTAVGLIIWYLYQDQKKQAKVSDFFLPNGSIGSVVTKSAEGSYHVKVRGEIWRATSAEEFAIGDRVEVVGVDKDYLTVQIKKHLPS